MKSDRHFWATLNYVHHNPVHHSYVQLWQDWPFSSVAAFLTEMGRERAAELWKAYPIRDMEKIGIRQNSELEFSLQAARRLKP